MGIDDRAFRLSDEIAALRRDEDLAREELIMLWHLDDDAQRDLATYDLPMDRADARETSGDVDRMARHVEELMRVRAKLERKRDRLVGKTGSE